MAIADETAYGLKGKQVKDIASRIKESAEGIEGLEETVAGKQDALSAAQLAAVDSGIDAAQVAQIATNNGAIQSLDADVAAIETKIPAQASVSNQLADKDFVNSSIATNTANFVGTFGTLEELEAVQNPTDNDYGFVASTVDGNTVYNRYKYNGTAWVFEYELNNSSFTAEQWAAIQSGITAGAVEKLDGIEAGAEENTIDSISVNGVVQTPDENKNVDLAIPEGIKTLTKADYDYPTDNPKMVNKNVLADGIYIANETIDVRGNIANALQTFNAGGIIIKSGGSFLEHVSGAQVWTFQKSFSDYSRGNILDSSKIIDNLTSSVATNLLSANQGRVLKDLVDAKQDALTFDSAPTENSTNPVTSGGVFEALAGAGGGSTIAMTDVDPGEGTPLEANHFIAVYDGGE